MERRNEKLRAEIEAVRSGTDSATRSVVQQASVRATTDICGFRVESLETQIVDLQSESTRLLRSLDTQKEEASREVAMAGRKVEELSRDNIAGEKEITTLKQKLKQYADYDEVKRELEIMKVCLCSRFRDRSLTS